MKHLHNYENFVNENRIGKISADIDLTFTIDKSLHAGERQFRHQSETGEIIEEQDILEILEEAKEEIINAIIDNKVDTNSKKGLVVYDSMSDINIVGDINGNSPNMVFTVITVMIKRNFKPYKGQYKITI